MKYIFSILIMSIICIFTSCKKEANFVINAGEQKTLVRDVEYFNKIFVNQNINLIISPNKEQNILISCGENLMDGIITEVNNDVLTLENQNKCNWLRNYNDNTVDVYVSLPELHKLTFYGSGKITCTDTIIGNDFFLDAAKGTGDINLLVNTTTFLFQIPSGSFDIKIKGKGTWGIINSLSYSLADFRDFEAEELLLTCNSTNNTFVNVSKKLTYSQKNIGNIYYSGNPEIIKSDTTGEGELIPNN